MEEFFKFLLRIFTIRDWRCHKRKLFFQALFKQLEIEDLNYHDMAGRFDYYPFCRSYLIEFYNLKVEIERASNIWKAIKSRKCDYDVLIEESGTETKKHLSLKFKEIIKEEWT